MNPNAFTQYPIGRPNRHIELYEKLEVALRQLGFDSDKARELVDDFVVACTGDMRSPKELSDAFLRKMADQAIAAGQLTKEERRRIEVERADKVLKETATLEETTVYVPTSAPQQTLTGEYRQKAIRLTKSNRHKVLGWKLEQQAQRRKAKQKGKR